MGAGGVITEEHFSLNAVLKSADNDRPCEESDDGYTEKDRLLHAPARACGNCCRNRDYRGRICRAEYRNNGGYVAGDTGVPELFYVC